MGGGPGSTAAAAWWARQRFCRATARPVKPCRSVGVLGRGRGGGANDLLSLHAFPPDCGYREDPRTSERATRGCLGHSPVPQSAKRSLHSDILFCWPCRDLCPLSWGWGCSRWAQACLVGDAHCLGSVQSLPFRAKRPAAPGGRGCWGIAHACAHDLAGGLAKVPLPYPAVGLYAQAVPEDILPMRPRPMTVGAGGRPLHDRRPGRPKQPSSMLPHHQQDPAPASSAASPPPLPRHHHAGRVGHQQHAAAGHRAVSRPSAGLWCGPVASGACRGTSNLCPPALLVPGSSQGCRPHLILVHCRDLDLCARRHPDHAGQVQPGTAGVAHHAGARRPTGVDPPTRVAPHRRVSGQQSCNAAAQLQRPAPPPRPAGPPLVLVAGRIQAGPAAAGAPGGGAAAGWAV